MLYVCRSINYIINFTVLPELEPSCFFVNDFVSCLKEFSSSASPSPHQDGWPYRGVPRGNAVTSPEADAHIDTFEYSPEESAYLQ